jgi:hypothetical protein
MTRPVPEAVEDGVDAAVCEAVEDCVPAEVSDAARVDEGDAVAAGEKFGVLPPPPPVPAAARVGVGVREADGAWPTSKRTDRVRVTS